MKFKLSFLALHFTSFALFGAGDEFNFPSLTNWANEVLQWREKPVPYFSERGYSPPSTVDSEDIQKEKIPLSEINQTIEQFFEKAKESSLGASENWIGREKLPRNFFEPPASKVTNICFAQKIQLPPETNIYVMGDLHGSVHSLLRYFLRLRVAGVIDDNFKIIKPATHLVFTGDLVDRGSFSTETLYTVLRLKLANWEHVHLIRGNHETELTATQYGLKEEVERKYNDYDLFEKMMKVVEYFPVVLLVADKMQQPNVLHFSHGGFSHNIDTRTFVHSPQNLIRAEQPIAYEVVKQACRGYLWSDFEQREESKPSPRGGPVAAGVGVFGDDVLTKYNEEFSAVGAKLVAIFRGHQDSEFGVKMFFKEKQNESVLSKIRSETVDYPNGPFHWKQVVNMSASAIPDSQYNAPTTVKLATVSQVVTLTSAAEGRGVPFDSYVVIKMAESPDEYLLEIHETPLPKNSDRDGYLTVSLATGPEHNGIKTEWSRKGPGKLLIKLE